MRSMERKSVQEMNWWSVGNTGTGDVPEASQSCGAWGLGLASLGLGELRPWVGIVIPTLWTNTGSGDP